MRRRPALILVVGAIALGVGSAFAPLPGTRRTFPGRRVMIEGEPGGRFLALTISPLASPTFADGKDRMFRTTYSGPVELLVEIDGRRVRRRALGVELQGWGRTSPITLRLR